MNPWTALLIGLLLGWLIEYAVDWFFWRRKPTDEQIVTDLQAQLQASENRAAALEAQLAETQSESDALLAKTDELESELAADAAAVQDYDHEEFRESLKGKLAALGVGAAAGAAIASGSDDDDAEEYEASDEVLADEVLLAEAGDELADDEDIIADESDAEFAAAAYAESEASDADSALEESADEPEDESAAELEGFEEEPETTDVIEGDEISTTEAGSDDVAELSEEVETMDAESTEFEAEGEANDESSVYDENDLILDGDSPEGSVDSTVESGFETD